MIVELDDLMPQIGSTNVLILVLANYINDNHENGEEVNSCCSYLFRSCSAATSKVYNSIFRRKKKQPDTRRKI